MRPRRPSRRSNNAHLYFFFSSTSQVSFLSHERQPPPLFSFSFLLAIAPQWRRLMAETVGNSHGCVVTTLARPAHQAASVSSETSTTRPFKFRAWQQLEGYASRSSHRRRRLRQQRHHRRLAGGEKNTPVCRSIACRRRLAPRAMWPHFVASRGEAAGVKNTSRGAAKLLIAPEAAGGASEYCRRHE